MEWRIRMITAIKNIYVRVIKARMANEGKSASEILAEYTRLTPEETTEIETAVMSQ